MKNKLIFLLMLVFITSCSFNNSTKTQPSEKELAMDAILVATANQLSQKYNVRCVGFAYGCMHQIEKLGLRFDFDFPISKEEARQFLVEGAQIMIEEVQNNKSIKSYLSEKGFTYKNVSIIAGIMDGKKLGFYPNASIVMLSGGEIDYIYDDPEEYQKSQVRQQKEKQTETFAEALALIKETKNENQ